jgi:hypothetical protein
MVFVLQSNALKLKAMWPTTDCVSETKEYMETDPNNPFSLVNTYDTWKEHAFDMYVQHKELVAEGKAMPNSVILKCFCDYEKKEGVKSDYVYSKDGEEISICDQYSKDSFQAFVMQNSISFLTIGANIVLKEVIIMLTQWVGYETFSTELTSITRGVFLAQFFNTGF